MRAYFGRPPLIELPVLNELLPASTWAGTMLRRMGTLSNSFFFSNRSLSTASATKAEEPPELRIERLTNVVRSASSTLADSVKKRPLAYFKEDFYADSAVFGSRAATICGLDFYGADKVLFASDCPFDPEGGPGYIRETIKIIDSLDIAQADRDKIYCGNLERLTGRTFKH